MKLNIYVNDILYKTIDSNPDGSYSHFDIVKGIQADREAGLLNNFNLGDKLPIRIEKVQTKVN